jgi:DDE_Tnp_1-associated
MEEKDLRDLETIFSQVEDPRVERTNYHRLRDIIIMAICGVICGAEGWVEIEEFGRAKEAWFTELLTLPNGIPSHDTFGRVFARIDPKPFEASFVQWVQGISQTVKGVIAIDGKTLRRSHDHASLQKSAPHGQCLGGGKPLGVGSVGHRREVERDHGYCGPFAAMSAGWLYGHH